MAEELLNVDFVTFLDGSVEEIRGYKRKFVEDSYVVFFWKSGESFLIPLRNLKHIHHTPLSE